MSLAGRMGFGNVQLGIDKEDEDMQKINIKNGIIEDIFNYEDKKKEYQDARDYNITLYSVSDSIINAIKSKSEDELTDDDKKRLAIREEIDKEYKSKMQYVDSCPSLVIIPYDGEKFDEETHTLVPQFNTKDGYVEQTFQPQRDEYKIMVRINELQKKLASTDYIVIKSYEAKLSNEDMPYSQEYLDKVFAERKSQREKINYLSDLIK